MSKTKLKQQTLPSIKDLQWVEDNKGQKGGYITKRIPKYHL